jgi:hypothetical protein
MANDNVIRLSRSKAYTPENYNARPHPTVVVKLVICDEDYPPGFRTSAGMIPRSLSVAFAQLVVSKLCQLRVDLTPLKPFKTGYGASGLYYIATFELVVSFGPEIKYGLAKDGQILGSISTNYV